VETIRLEEYGSVLVPDLSTEDLRFLAAKHGRAVTTVLEPASNLPRLTATSWVGVITLPSGRELRIVTKVPVANLFHMLAVVGEWPFRPADVVGYEPDATILYVVARHFRDLLLQVDESGLYRAYRDEAENLTTLRGRIDFREDLRRNLIERQRTACSFSDFTRDIPENQILRQTAHLLAECGLVGNLAGDFRNLDYWWSDIASSNFDSNVVTRFVYHRLNDHYRPIHQLATILLQWLSPGGTEGDRRFPAFLVNMFWLYEAFVRRSLELVIRNTDYQVRKPRPLNLDESGRAHFQPDLLFMNAGVPVLVADCKYKRTGVDMASEADLYQMVAYCTALGLKEGVLVYPRHLVDLDDNLAIRSSAIRLHRMTIDLGLPLTELESECLRLASRLLDLHRLAPADGARTTQSGVTTSA
jgi:5-methylcytosine-specific restriction enzyme subunit McrC